MSLRCKVFHLLACVVIELLFWLMSFYNAAVAQVLPFAVALASACQHVKHVYRVTLLYKALLLPKYEPPLLKLVRLHIAALCISS